MGARGGFKQVNIDLIAGMLGDTEEKWKVTVQKAIELDPDSVTIYQMEVPFNTTIAARPRLRGTRGDPDRVMGRETGLGRLRVQAVRGPGVQGQQRVHAGEAFDARGFVYRDSLWRGRTWWERALHRWPLSGVHYQNVDKWEITSRTWMRGSCRSTARCR